MAQHKTTIERVSKATKYLAARVPTSAIASADPIVPLAHAVGRRIRLSLDEIGTQGQWNRRTTVVSLRSPKPEARAKAGQAKTISLQAVLDEIDARLERAVKSALQDSLTQHSAEGKALRMSLIGRLATEEMTPVDAPARAASPGMSAGSSDRLLSTAEAARLLGVSRPYVAMLCDNGKLGPIETTDGGHRRITLAAVDQYREASLKQHADAPTLRQAGIEAGLYDHDDSHYANVVRGEDATVARRGIQKKPLKKARR